MNDVQRQECEHFKLSTRIPFWTFSGLGAIVALILYLGALACGDHFEMKERYQSPIVGDIYSFKTAEGKYSAFKIEEVKSDSLFIRYSQFETGVNSRLDQIATELGYESLVYMHPRAFLDSLWDANAILKIETSLY